MNSTRTNSFIIFFIIFTIVCISISILFYFLFRRTDVPLPSYYPPKTPTGLPGMDKDTIKYYLSQMDDSTLGKPLPEPTMPVAPKALTVTSQQSSAPAIPLIGKAEPARPPARKRMMT